jgi:radical SAM superfamily enzyme YgiQ (UPF0313 family)
MKRPNTTMTDFDEIVEDARRVGLHVIAYGILGMPGQTIQEMVDTLIYLMGKRVLIGPSVYYPTPGTPLFQRCKEEGILPSLPSQWRSSAIPIETKDFDRLDIITLFRLARVINFIKGKMDKKELDEGMTWKELYQILKGKVKAKVEVKDKHEVTAEVEKKSYGLCDEDDAISWIDLLLLLIREKSFFSLRKDSKGSASILREPSSKKVLEYFFEKAWEKPILKNRHD